MHPKAKSNLPFQLSKQNRALDSLAGVILVSLSAKGCVEHINTRGCRLLGFSEAELIGRDWFEYCESDPKNERAEFHRLMSSTAGFPEHLLGRVKIRTGEVHSIFWHTLVRKNSRGRVLGVLRSGVDLSASGSALGSLVEDLSNYQQAQQELAQRQAEINRARKQLAFASRMSTLGEIATGIAHEVNQPLAAIASYATAGSHLLESGRFSQQEVSDLLNKINMQARRAGGVVHKVRSQISTPDKQRCNVNVNTVLRDTLDLLDLVHDAEDTRIEFDLVHELPMVEIDIIDLQQVMLGLMRNAIEAMNDTAVGMKVLRLCTRIVAPHSILVSITDSGVGISRQHASDIYEPFFTTKTGSVGMGLTIGRSIINTYDGVLRHCPAKPCGSKFYFTLPAVTTSKVVSFSAEGESVTC